MIFIQRLINLGVLESDSSLGRIAKQLFNIDIIIGIAFPVIAEISLHLIAAEDLQYSLINLITILFFIIQIYLVKQGDFRLSVFFLQIFAFATITASIFIYEIFTAALFYLPFSLNPFIYFPENRKIALNIFLLFLLSSVGFSIYELTTFDLISLSLEKLTFLKIHFTFFITYLGYKIVQLVSLYRMTMKGYRDTQIALMKSESRYRSFFEKVKVGMATKSNGRIIDANPAFLNLLGYEREEMIGMQPKKWIHPQDYKEAKRKVKQGEISSSLPQEFAQRIYTKEGQLLNVLVTIASLGESNPIEEKEEIITLMDLTPIKRAEQALVETENRYKSLFENSFNGITIYDTTENRLVECNQKLLQIFGVNKEQILTDFPVNYLPPRQSSGVNSMAFLLKQGKKISEKGIAQFEIDCIKGDRSPMQLDVTSFTLPKPDNHLSVSIFKDISEKKKQQSIIDQNIKDLNQKNKDLEKYIESNLQLENFAYIASHDLKAPIRTIGSFAKLLKRKAAPKLDTSELEFLEFINKGAENMSRLVEDLLTYSKANTENHQLGILNLPNLLEIIQHELGVSIKESHATIKCQGIPKTIFADSTKMRQLFQNLIANALKFRKANVPPLIEITGREDHDFWYFTVRDNGIGIKEEFHEKIFMLFRKLHGNNEFEGSGIGLSLCKKIVEQHHGNLSIDSKFGEYTQFDFSIKKNNRNTTVTPGSKESLVTV